MSGTTSFSSPFAVRLYQLFFLTYFSFFSICHTKSISRILHTFFRTIVLLFVIFLVFNHYFIKTCVKADFPNKAPKSTHFPTVENAVSSKRSPSKQLRFPQKAEFKRSSFKRSQASNEKSPVMYVTYTAFFTLGKRIDARES